MGPHPSLRIRIPIIYDRILQKQTTARLPREIWHPKILYTVFIHAIPMVTTVIGGVCAPYPYIWLFLAHSIFAGIYVLHLIAYHIYEPTADLLKYEFYLDSICANILLTAYETVWLILIGIHPLRIVLSCVVHMVLASKNHHCTSRMGDRGALLWHAMDASHRMCLIVCVLFTTLSMS